MLLVVPFLISAFLCLRFAMSGGFGFSPPRPTCIWILYGVSSVSFLSVLSRIAQAHICVSSLYYWGGRFDCSTLRLSAAYNSPYINFPHPCQVGKSYTSLSFPRVEFYVFAAVHLRWMFYYNLLRRIFVRSFPCTYVCLRVLAVALCWFSPLYRIFFAHRVLVVIFVVPMYCFCSRSLFLVLVVGMLSYVFRSCSRR